MEGAESLAPNIYTGLEGDRHTYRVKKDIEAGWNKQSNSEAFPEVLRQLDIDSRITNLAEASLKFADRSLTVLDIGSGEPGVLIHAFLKPQEFPQLHKFLRQHPGFTLRVVGVTGAGPQKLQGRVINQEEVMVGRGKNPSKIKVENYGYTVTRAHVLDRLLMAKGIGRIGLAFSTFGVGYFTPANFEQCLTDVADKLQPGGAFYGIAYDWVPAGFRRSGYMGNLLLNGQISDGHPLVSVFEGFQTRGKEFEQLSPQEKLQQFLGSIDYCINRGLITESDAVELIRDMSPAMGGVFFDHFDHYATDEQKREMRKFIDDLIQSETTGGKSWYVSGENWRQAEAMFEDISEVRVNLNQVANQTSAPSMSEEEVKSQVNQAYKTRYGNSDPSLPNFEDLEDQVRFVEMNSRSHFEEKYLDPKFAEVVEVLDKLKAETEGSSWQETKVKLAEIDSVITGELLEWEFTLYELKNLITNRLGDKTLSLKQKALEKLSTREDLLVYFNELNFYIGKIQ